MSKKVNVDFTGVESFKRASEGDHVCKIVSADMKQSQGGNDMIVVAYEVTKGEDKTARVYENYPLVENALWKLKGMLNAIGMKADGKVSLDLDKLIGKVVIVAVKHEEYDGKIRARVDEVKKFTASAPDEDEDYDDEEEAEEAIKPKKNKATQKKAPMNPPADEDEDDDWEEEDDEEEEEKPAPKKSAKAEKPKATEKKAPKKAAKKVEEDDDDWDDDDWDE